MSFIFGKWTFNERLGQGHTHVSENRPLLYFPNLYVKTVNSLCISLRSSSFPIYPCILRHFCCYFSSYFFFALFSACETRACKINVIPLPDIRDSDKAIISPEEKKPTMFGVTKTLLSLLMLGALHVHGRSTGTYKKTAKAPGEATGALNKPATVREHSSKEIARKPGSSTRILEKLSTPDRAVTEAPPATSCQKPGFSDAECPACLQPGNPEHNFKCNAFYSSWYFSYEKQKCVRFTYRGCGGNYNRFDEESQCLKFCARYIDNLYNHYSFFDRMNSYSFSHR